MSLLDKILNKRHTIPTEQTKSFLTWIEDGCPPRGYRRLADIPEVKAGVEKIAEIISTMTIHLMQNTENGDVRIKNGLSNLVDIRPNKQMGKQLFISWVIQEMLINGNAVAKVKTKKGFIEELEPVPENKRSWIKSNPNKYVCKINGKLYEDAEILNFRFNPDIEYPFLGKSQEHILKELTQTLGQAQDTITGFMRNRMTPGVIVKVGAMTEDFKSEAGRSKLEERYLKRAENGQPWIIPDMIDIQTIKPLTLNDIAIHETVKVTKEAVAAILGLPPFLLGIGAFDREEYNNFIKTKVAVICKAIEQELTFKILTAPSLYFQFNRKSLLNYSISELGGLYADLYTKGIVTANEVRDILGMSPLEGLDQLILLENYIKLEDIQNQNKLKGGGQDEE